MSEPSGTGTLTGQALADQLARRLVARRDPRLFRVVEVVRDADGRVTRHGQVWHADLDHVRRFGRALAANAAPASCQVLVADAAGRVLERIAVAATAPDAAAWQGWDGGWRRAPLPPPPPRPVTAPAAAAPRRPPRDIPTLQAEADAPMR